MTDDPSSKRAIGARSTSSLRPTTPGPGHWPGSKEPAKKRSPPMPLVTVSSPRWLHPSVDGRSQVQRTNPTGRVGAVEGSSARTRARDPAVLGQRRTKVAIAAAKPASRTARSPAASRAR